MAAAFVIALAIVLVKGVVPGFDDLLRIFLFFIAAMLYCTVFFAIAMMISAIAKNTAMSAIFTVGVIVLLALYSLLAIGISYWVADKIAGPAPEEFTYSYTVRSQMENGTFLTPDYTGYSEYQTKKQQITQQISDIITVISPVNGFSGTLGVNTQGIGNALLSNPSYTYYVTTPNSLASINLYREASLTDVLGSVWTKVLALLVEIAAAFGIAYVAFMRTDIR